MSKSVGRKQLFEIDADTVLNENVIPDRRAEDIAALTVVDAGLMDTLREVFEGTSLLADQRKVRLVLKLRADVTVAWGQTRDAFLDIGRALLDINRELEPAERDRLKIGFRRLFPFSETVASQFRSIARAVDEGRLPRELVPGSYATAYQLSLLTPSQRVAAEKAGLIRPDVPREAVIEFRRHTAPRTRINTQGVSLARMRAELERLERQRRQKLEDLVGIRRRLVELRELLKE
jgi:hypothetical protein